MKFRFFIYSFLAGLLLALGSLIYVRPKPCCATISPPNPTMGWPVGFVYDKEAPSTCKPFLLCPMGMLIREGFHIYKYPLSLTPFSYIFYPIAFAINFAIWTIASTSVVFATTKLIKKE